jgi:hypothetical protein
MPEAREHPYKMISSYRRGSANNILNNVLLVLWLKTTDYTIKK